MSLATPAADASGLYVRTLTKLFRLQAPAASTATSLVAAPVGPPATVDEAGFTRCGAPR